MKFLLVALFTLSVFASELSTSIFKSVRPALVNAMALNDSYGEILNEAQSEEKLGDKLSLKVLKQLKAEKLQLQKSAALISIVDSKLKLRELTEMDKVNLIKMKESLNLSMKRNKEKISTLRSILLASRNHSLNKV
jgi:hypothetical protein